VRALWRAHGILLAALAFRWRFELFCGIPARLRRPALICPQCFGEQCHRSRRRGVKDYAVGFANLRPWRCNSCRRRFYARSVAFPFASRVHCRRCGRMELQRIRGKHITGFWSRIWRLLRVPAYRCDPCRNNFFSLRPYRPVRSFASRQESGPESRPNSNAASA
jgi:hypothetical protein